MKIEEPLVAATMAAIALITAANVVTRYLSNVSLAFTEEYSVALMIGLALLGTALAVARGTHIRIPFFVEKLSPRGQRIAEAVAMALTILCFGLLALHGAKLAYDEWDFEFVSSGLGHPQFLYTMWLPILSLVVIARALQRMIRSLRGHGP
ncbi:TRAP transporter small permease [Plastoroseomonas arctica]|nr:TRAP transporter small permease [Plastoroseomonas arctica]